MDGDTIKNSIVSIIIWFKKSILFQSFNDRSNNIKNYY